MEEQHCLLISERINFILFVDDVEALKNVWCIGDKFLEKTFAMMPVLKTQNKLCKNKDLYLQIDYNLSAFFTPSEDSLKPTITRIFNSLVKALNDNDHLPKYILVICNKDILDSMETTRFDPKKLIRGE